MTRYWEGTRHFFLRTFYNLKNIGGARAPPVPCSAVPACSTLTKVIMMSFTNRLVLSDLARSNTCQFLNAILYPKVIRDRGATLRFGGGGGGAPLVPQYWGGWHKTLFLTNSL